MFGVYYSHVKAHQDDTAAFDKLSRKSQLNCICDHLAKQCLNKEDTKRKGGGLLFPLEPFRVFIGTKKLSSETAPLL
jgi:hypothetical protein